MSQLQIMDFWLVMRYFTQQPTATRSETLLRGTRSWILRLTLAYSSHFSNQTYFQAEPPKRLTDISNLVRGIWFEVDVMSTGMLLFQYLIDSCERPIRPPGHPEIPILRWKRDTAFRIFGASSPQLMDGLCGAPFVEVETGNVAGFFHLAYGDWAECEHWTTLLQRDGMLLETMFCQRVCRSEFAVVRT